MLVVFLHTDSHMAAVHSKCVCVCVCLSVSLLCQELERIANTQYCSAKYITRPKVVDPNKHDVSARHRVYPQADYKFW